MKKFILFSMAFILFFINSFGQIAIEEPEYIGEAILVIDDTNGMLLDKEYGEIKSTVSLSSNDVRKLYIQGGSATCKAKRGEIQFIIRANDNNSDPMSLITIYKMHAKKKERSVALSVDHSDNPFASSKTYSKDKMKFQGKKYGNSSYLITTNLETGEYGIIIKNPNGVDEKSPIVSCIGITE